VTSLTYPQNGLVGFKAIPLAQLRGSIGVGELNFSDVEAADREPFWPLRPAVHPYPQVTGRARREQRHRDARRACSCDAWFDLEAALNEALALTYDGVIKGMDRLGSGHLSALLVDGRGTHFGPGSHDGASYYRPLAFAAGCSCYRYPGPPVSTT